MFSAQDTSGLLVFKNILGLQREISVGIRIPGGLEYDFISANNGFFVIVSFRSSDRVYFFQDLLSQMEM